MLNPILFEIIQLQGVDSAAKSNISRKKLFILEELRTLTLPVLTDSLQSVFLIKRMWLKWIWSEFFLPVDWILLFEHSWIWKTSIAYARPAQHTARGPHEASESFLNCRKCCTSSTSNKQLSFGISSILQISASKWNRLAPCGKFMLIIWPFEVSELCRPGLYAIMARL